MATRFPVTLFWGAEFALVYNEAYVPLIGEKHPGALGTPAREVFPEVWDLIGPMMAPPGAGAPTWVQDEAGAAAQAGFLEECYFTFSYSPVRNQLGEVEGVMDIATDTTGQVISRRRLQLLTAVAERSANALDLEDLIRLVLPLLRSATEDLPVVDLRLPGTWVGDRDLLPHSPFDGRPVLTERVEAHEDGHIAWLPLIDNDTTHSPVLVVSLSRRLAPDEEYLGFLRLLTGTLGQAVASIRVRRAEREIAQVQRTMAEAFQHSLLPPPAAPGGPHLAMRYQPALELAELGGDWYDWFQAPDGSLHARHRRRSGPRPGRGRHDGTGAEPPARRRLHHRHPTPDRRTPWGRPRTHRDRVRHVGDGPAGSRHDIGTRDRAARRVVQRRSSTSRTDRSQRARRAVGDRAGAAPRIPGRGSTAEPRARSSRAEPRSFSTPTG